VGKNKGRESIGFYCVEEGRVSRVFAMKTLGKKIVKFSDEESEFFRSG